MLLLYQPKASQNNRNAKKKKPHRESNPSRFSSSSSAMTTLALLLSRGTSAFQTPSRLFGLAAVRRRLNGSILGGVNQVRHDGTNHGSWRDRNCQATTVNHQYSIGQRRFQSSLPVLQVSQQQVQGEAILEEYYIEENDAVLPFQGLPQDILAKYAEVENQPKQSTEAENDNSIWKDDNTCMDSSIQKTSLFQITAPFEPTGDQPQAIQLLVQRLQQDKDRFAVLQGITGTGKTLVMSHAIAKCGKPTLVLCHNKTLAAQLARELRSFLGTNAVELFVSYYNHYVPEFYNEVSGTYGAKKSSINHDIDAMRHRATRALLTRNDVVIVASVSCIYGLGLPEDYLDASRTLAVGDVMVGTPQEFMTDILQTAMLYQHEPSEDDLERGKYQATRRLVDSSEGETSRWDITLWPPHESFPLRIELEQKAAQDISTTTTTARGIAENDIHGSIRDTNNDQENETWFVRSIQQGHAGGHDPIQSTVLFPAKHHVMAEDRLELACLAIEEECEQRVKELNADGKLEESSRLQQRVCNDVLMMRETGFCSGGENYSRHLTGRAPGQTPATLMDYFSMKGREWLLMVDESHVTLPQLRAMYGGDQARKRRLVHHGYRLPSALDNRPLKEEEFWQRVQQGLFVSATPSKRELELSEHAPVEMVVRPTFICDPHIIVKEKDGQLRDLADEVRKRSMHQERTLAVTLTKRDAEDLADYLIEQGIPSTYIHSGLNTQERAEALKALQSGKVSCLVGVNLLREGLDLPQVSLVAILNTDSEGFLRSETALLQMVGRAARNTHGTAIFYADRVTQSMQKCIDATNARRERQLAYAKENGCKPVTTKGSSMLSIFDLLKDEIADEQTLEVVGRKKGPVHTTTTNGGEFDVVHPDITLRFEENTAAEVTTDHVPSTPGVYFWKDTDGRILYIGKAKKLRSRIRSYLAPSAKHSARIKVMMKKAHSIDFILTGSERDALMLESNMIKYHQPPYNVLLKDDESYPYICASIGDVFPRFSAVPRRQEGHTKYRYFGPYTDFKEVNKILQGIEEKYDLRSKSFMARHGSDEISKDDYNRFFQTVLDENFNANGSAQKTDLEEMRLQFEEAGVLFDPVLSRSRDVVAIADVPDSSSTTTTAVVHLVQFRKGTIAGRFSYNVELPSGIHDEEDRASVIQTCLERRHYPAGEESPDRSFSFFPEEVLVQHLADDNKDLKRVIRSSRQKVEPERNDKLEVRRAAQRGKRKDEDHRAMGLAVKNAEQVAYERSLWAVPGVVKSSVDGTGLSELAALLNLEREPSRIECYDVSHSQGDFPVASRVVFIDGKPVKELYRKFNIRTVEGIDDYASLEEALSRRFKRAWVNGAGPPVDKDDPWSMPDVVLIDGGPGQLSAAAKGMAKARVFPVDGKGQQSPVMGDNRSATVAVCSLAKNHEELFVYGNHEPVNESSDSPALLLLRALRDESHRFALKAHRSRRSVRKST